MNYKTKEEYRLLIQPRYQRANKAVKKKILDEFCAVCGYHRKYAIALLKKPVRVKKEISKPPGPKPRYQDADFLKALQRIWYETDLSCAKRLKAAIPLWLPKYEQHYGELNEEIQHKLLTISSASIDRVLKPIRERIEIKKRSQTKPGTLLKHKIPYKLDVPWNSSLPGFVEADTVSHCGGNVSGNYAWSLTLTDIRTTWTENRAVWNKGCYGILMQIKDIEDHLPFSLLGSNCDSGVEFLNQHLMGYFQEKKKPNIVFARSRPNKKNDNAHVEQKNWTHVRHLFGYRRLGKFGVDKLMNDLYKNEWRLYQNFFMPSMKLVEKTRIGARYRKKYDSPQTPYQRVLQEPSITREQKEKLSMIYKTLDPFSLRKSIKSKLNQILKFSGLK